MPSPKIIEIASYPKCGNTWLRYILAQAFSVDPNQDIPDVHQMKDMTFESIRKINLECGNFGFYKSHILDNPSIATEKIILIYRHPLDVFFSSLNYFKLHGQHEKFIGGVVKSVEEIYRDGELEHYFSEFCDDVGLKYFNGMLGEKSNYQVYLSDAFSNSKVIPVKYEDLIDRPVEAINSLLSSIIPCAEKIDESVFFAVDKQTKFSNNPFFWKAKKETYKEYLSSEQVERFLVKNTFFKSVGY